MLHMQWTVVDGKLSAAWVEELAETVDGLEIGVLESV